MGEIWNEVFYKPILNSVVILYNALPFLKLGLSIIIMTILLRIVLYPFFLSSMKQQTAMQKLQPELQKLKKKYKGKENAQKLNEETMKLYAEHKVNPVGGCLPLLIQMPVMIALYRVFISFNKAALTGFFGYHEVINPLYKFEHINKLLYSFVPQVQYIDFRFLVWNLAQPDPTWVLPIIAGILQYAQIKMTMTQSQDETQKAMNQTALLMPVMIIMFSGSLPAALPLYWIASTVVGMVQTMIVKKERYGNKSTNIEKSKK